MNFYTVFILILLIGDFLLETLVETLNLKQLGLDLPKQYKAEFKELYEPEKYRTYLNYQKANTRLGLLQRTLNLAATLAFIFWGGFNWIDQGVRSFGFGMIVTGLLYFGALGLLRLALSLPFSLYDTFVIEARYGFNKTSLSTFAGDLLKGGLLSILLGGPVLALLLYFFEAAGSTAWLYAWLALTLIQVVLLFLAPAFILPLFNRFEPLAEGPLKKAIQEYASQQDFKLSGIFQMDASKRSTKSNAFFTGFGQFRRLVLFDTLIQKHSTEELVAVLAHEIGHFKKKHILKSVLFSIFSTGLLFYFLSLFLNNRALFKAFQMESLSIYASLVFIGFLYAPISKLLSIFSNWLSRKNEFEADRFARDTYGNPEALISALKKMSVDHLSHMTPHPLKVFLEYTHPPVIQRIEALRRNFAPSPPSAEILSLLKAGDWMLSTVESCTGGMIASRITDIPGSSQVFWGALITYDNSAKESLCGVPQATLEKYGAVSSQTAAALAQGGLKKMQEALASQGVQRNLLCVSTTGIAGPSGGTSQKPVGLCFVGLARTGHPTDTFEIHGEAQQSRSELRELFTQEAISRVLAAISPSPSSEL